MSSLAQNQFQGRIAGQNYDAVLKTISPFYNPLLDLMAAQASAILGDKEGLIYDLGCGTGLSTRPLAAACWRAKIVAVDISRKMLDAVPADLRTNPRIEWCEGDLIETLHAAAGHSIDVITDGYAVHNLLPEKRAELFTLLGDKLRPGGIFTFVDKIAVDDEQAHQVMLAARKKAYSGLACLGFSEESAEWLRHYDFDESIRMSEREVREGLMNAGFSQVYFHDRASMYVFGWAVR